MALLLRKVSKEVSVADNSFCPEAAVAHLESLIQVTHDPYKLFELKSSLGVAFLKLGEEQKAIEVYEALLKTSEEGDVFDKEKVLPQLALAYLRLGALDLIVIALDEVKQIFVNLALKILLSHFFD